LAPLAEKGHVQQEWYTETVRQTGAGSALEVDMMVDFAKEKR